MMQMKINVDNNFIIDEAILNNLNQFNQPNQINQQNLLNQINLNNQLRHPNHLEEKNTINQTNKEKPLNQNNLNYDNINSEEKQNDIRNINYLIYKNYQKFMIKIQTIRHNKLNISNINQIDDYLMKKILIHLPVYLIEKDNLHYCKEQLTFSNFRQLEKTNDNRAKDEIKKKITNPDFSIIQLGASIISLENIITSLNLVYSFVDKNFCVGIKLPEQKYKQFEGLLFINNQKIFLYYKKQKKLFKVQNYKDNKFQLLKINKIQSNKENSNFKIVDNFNSNKNNNLKNEDIIIPYTNYSVHCLGLENIGATCYMNATLLCVCNISSLKNYFENIIQVNKDINNREAPLTRSFSELLNKLWSQTFETYYAPHNFKNIVSNLNPLFRGIQANDSKDLIIFIYETLHNELNNPPSSNDNIMNDLNNKNLPEELKLFRQNYYSQNNSIMTQIFYSEQSSNLKCCSCDVNKISFNIINFLIFPLEKIKIIS